MGAPENARERSDGAMNASANVPAGATTPVSARSSREWRAPLMLAALTALVLAPFTGKAFHIDDPLFMWTAQRILEHPFDFYGFDVNWFGWSQPMSQAMQNPPLASYYAALVGSVFGFGERAMHVAFLVPAALCIVGTWRLARRLACQPVLAALIALATPAFFVSGTSVMCDVFMLCLWVWAIVLWIEGLDRGRSSALIAASVLVLAASLAKYFGIALIPLLVAYTFARGRAYRRQALWLLAPVAGLVAFEAWTARLYGVGLISYAAQYARTHHDTGTSPKYVSLFLGLTFTGGCMLPALLFAPRTHSLRALACCAAIGLAIAAVFALRGTTPFPGIARDRDVGWTVASQVAVYAAVGASILWSCAVELRERRDADALLLASWVVGTFVFASFVNWSVNVRSLLPMAPAVGMLIARRRTRVSALFAAAALAPAFLVSASVAWADARLADTGRSAARDIREHYSSELPDVWFEGHWGFQYYMQAWGARPLDYASFALRVREVLVIPHHAVNVEQLPKRTWEAIEILDYSVPSWLATMNPDAFAGFYASNFGILPFRVGTIGRATSERYEVLRIVQPVAARR
jgi:4-amino-4-deoxy-L-arabinose transferase-like glycosyltransferase